MPRAVTTFPKQIRQESNWPGYETGLRQRGDLTVWFSEAAIGAWNAEPLTSRGSHPWYSPIAILTVPKLGTVFRFALCRNKCLIGSVTRLLGLDHRGQTGRDAAGASSAVQHRC